MARVFCVFSDLKFGETVTCNGIQVSRESSMLANANSRTKHARISRPEPATPEVLDPQLAPVKQSRSSPHFL